ncbi:MAG: ATP-dependent DNA helicase RecG [Pseudobdellovibrionaceae bacterium]
MTAKKPSLKLETDVQYLKGVGPKLGELFAKKGIHTVFDLLKLYPRAYEDRRAARNIASLNAEEVVSLKAQVLKVTPISMGRSHRKIYDVTLRDASGVIHAKYFRVPYRGYFERFQPFHEYRVIGKVINYRGRLEFHHPDIRDLESEEEIQDDLIPIYSEMENLTSSKIQRLIRAALDQVSEAEWPAERFPKSLMEKCGLISLKDALYQIHKPSPEMSQVLLELKSPAHRRLIFEEFFWLELYLAAKKSGLKKEQGLSILSLGVMRQRLLQSLPFQLTGAQLRCADQVHKDLQGPHPMNRLVQGDVGSGKTLVAFMAALDVIEAGYQATLMAPTEILAEQHFRNAEKILSPLRVKLGLLTGKSKASERRALIEQLLAGDIHLLIGTHALIEDPVQFKALGLVIIDEQHRFGVQQRAQLKQKGHSPHFLVMTATPIPRTLAMTVYGDLDVSLIDEMPPGRSPIQTRVAFESKRKMAFDFMAEQVSKGRQAYVVYPLVDESEKIDLKNAVQEFEKLKAEYPKIRWALMHGRMKSDEKDEVMEAFRRHEHDVLVSTTVIEVGVDVPNANVMMVEHAERFGLSQLHQLRGRVGRGTHKSFCVLMMGHAVSEEGRERTRFMETTTDGFKVAEKDLEMRGPGEFLGTRQSGLAGFQLANLVRDVMILQEARDAAFEIFLKDPEMKSLEIALLRDELFRAHGITSLAGIA